MKADGKPPVIVTWRGLSGMVSGQEAVSQIEEIAKSDPTASDAQKAAAAAAMGKVLRELQKADSKAGVSVPVLTAPHHGPSSRMQSLVASGENANSVLTPLSTGGLEAKFDTNDWLGWATVAWEKLKHLNPHPMLPPPSVTPEPMPESARIALLGDWATGLYGAPKIAEAVSIDSDPFAMLLHLGDVYYSGTSDEVQKRFLNLWPSRPESINRALNSNHEMYSGGDAYFNKTLKHFNQSSSYFATQNKHWTFVGLDVAFRDHSIDDEQVDWLKKVLAQAGDRKVILFSHHQLYSHFESQGERLWGHAGLAEILNSKRIFAWYWGHEHRCSIFEGKDPRFGIFARCIGHGGMPESRDATRDLPSAEESKYQDADWRRSPSQAKLGNVLPGCIVLEGSNPDILGEEDKFTPHGYAIITVEGPTLKEQVLTSTGKVIYSNYLVP